MAFPYVRISVKSREAIERIKAAAKNNGEKRFVEIGVTNKPTIATYAAYNEFGWAQTVTKRQSGFLRNRYGLAIMPGMHLVCPPRPFLGGTARAEGKKWAKLLGATLKVRGIESLDDALLMVGQIAQQDVKTTIANNGTSKEKFPDRSEVTLAIYSQQDTETDSGRPRERDSTGGLDREQALVKTGTLLASIGYWLRED